MGEKSQNHQEQEANPQLNPAQQGQDQAPVSDFTSPAEAVQAVKNAPRSAVRPSHLLALQRTVGNRAVQRVIESVQPSTVAPGSVQRHVSPESEAMYGQSRAQVTAAKDQTKNSLKSAESGAQGMLSSWNSLMNAFTAARSLPAGGNGDQSPQGSEDIYEG